MGNLLSNVPTREPNEGEINESETMSDFHDAEDNENVDVSDEDTARILARNEEMDEFKRQLNIKREQRQEILARHRTKKEELEKSLENEKIAKLELYETNKLLRELLTKNNIDIPDNLVNHQGNCELTNALVEVKEEFESLKSSNNKLRRDLAETNRSLQNAYSDIADLNGQNVESMKQIHALKEVVVVSKTMINLREQQLNDLKNKLSEIEQTLADRETSLLSADLRQEYARQLKNIRTLRGLYEERARLAEVTRQGLVRDLDEHKVLYQAEVKKNKDLSEKVEDLDLKIDELIDALDDKNSQISTFKKETNELKAEMTVVNKLFSQVLLGYKTKQDLDTLVHRLEENHGLLIQMAENENGSEASSALPKLLLELVSQVDDDQNQKSDVKDGELQKSEEELTSKEIERQTATNSTAEEIVENLPKVWKVLIELLSHQSVTEENTEEKVTTCYKSVETKSGPVLVPSVSQTYIRLKDLIIEKLGLVREVNRMKQLNSHLETRLGEQESRLCLVTNELSKTWHVVGRLRRHHHQLHTHEKILKYELQQKRKLLNELKEELAYCREKWEQAREKNTQSEKDWKTLRTEFSNRKLKAASPSFNNSGESGYSDERPSDESSESNDESEYVAKPLIRCKKKNKKSFETALDSSADYNFAEREDPASDMLDVADLPLDTQDGDENNEDNCEKSKNERLYKSLKVCEETEDEVCDITHDDSITEEISTEEKLSDVIDNIIEPKEDKNTEATTSHELLDQIPLLDVENTEVTEEIDENTCETDMQELNNPTSTNKTEVPVSSEVDELQEPNLMNEETTETDNLPDFKAILESVRQQDERLAAKDRRLLSLESGCAKVVKDITSTLTTGDEIIEKLDSLHGECVNLNLDSSVISEVSDSDDTIDIQMPSTSNDVNHEARFAARDIRLKRLEEQTKSLVNKMNDTTTKGVKIHYKLEELHNIYGSENSRAGTPSEEVDETAKVNKEDED